MVVEARSKIVRKGGGADQLTVVADAKCDRPRPPFANRGLVILCISTLLWLGIAIAAVLLL